MNKEVVIFDFDGVIANTFEMCYEISKLDDPRLTRDEYRQRFAGNINHARPGRERTQEVDFFAEFGKRILDAPLFDGMKDVIEKISEAHKMVIVSSTITPLIDGYLVHHNLRDKFEDILGNDVATSKVEKINTVLRRYGVTSNEAVLIADTVGDITEARQAGVPTIAVTWGYQPKEMLEGAMPNALVENPIDLPTAIADYLTPNFNT